jgi:hypothetical protein
VRTLKVPSEGTSQPSWDTASDMVKGASLRIAVLLLVLSSRHCPVC